MVQPKNALYKKYTLFLFIRYISHWTNPHYRKLNRTISKSEKKPTNNSISSLKKTFLRIKALREYINSISRSTTSIPDSVSLGIQKKDSPMRELYAIRERYLQFLGERGKQRCVNCRYFITAHWPPEISCRKKEVGVKGARPYHGLGGRVWWVGRQCVLYEDRSCMVSLGIWEKHISNWIMCLGFVLVKL